jgi:hypothetical protein
VELWGNGSSLTNSGLIRSSAANGIVLQSQAGETITVLNTGSIKGNGSYAILGGAGSDRVTNKGKITGSISLGDGDDLYDGRDGSITKEIVLGQGNDTAYHYFGTPIIEHG